MAPKVTEAHLESRRQQILIAAVACFSRNGFHKTTIRDICDEAGLSTGAVYRYYSSKSEIIAAIAEMGRQNTNDLLLQTRADGAAQTLAQMVSGAIAFLNSADAKESNRLSLRLWGEALDTPQIRDLFLESLASAAEPFADAVQSGQEAGAIDSRIQPDAAGRIFVAIGLGLTVQATVDPEADFTGLSQVISALLDGTFATDRSSQ